MPAMFQKTTALKYRRRKFPLPGATIDDRPAHEVVRERKLETSPRRRITKAEFHARGGLKNSQLFRKTDKAGRWMHFEVLIG
jgi:hypothetical protein